MRTIKNTLYITEPGAYLSLDGENVVVSRDNEIVGRRPLHLLQSIVIFGYSSVSPALMGKCASYCIEISFMSLSGRFLGRFVGEPNGNVLLRKEQYRISDSKERSLDIAKSFIIGKLYNSRWGVERVLRDNALRVDSERLKQVSMYLNQGLEDIGNCFDIETLRGIEGEAASMYFSIFNDMILQQKEDFKFVVRNRRPPLDPVNALLSYTYTLLGNEASWALSSVGLDPYVGFLHSDRPGRISLALDLMEEFRCILADKFVLMLINKRIIKISDFCKRENGAVLISDTAKKSLLMQWQKRKQEAIVHPFTGEKMQWGMVIYTQAQLLARYIRGDIDAYPPLMWK